MTDITKAKAAIHRSQNLISRANLDDSVTVLDINDYDRLIQIDGLAAQAWLLIDGKRSFEQIYVTLIRRENPPKTRFTRDLKALFRKLEQLKLIES